MSEVLESLDRAGSPRQIHEILFTPPLYFEEIKEYRRIMHKRRDLYDLRFNARKVFLNEGVRLGFEYAHDYHRTAKCGHVRISDGVGLHVGVEHKKAFFTGLAQCGNVHTCPVCAAKIQERRRKEVSAAMDLAYSQGKKCVMVTFTFPHTSEDHLSVLLKKQSSAFVSLRGGKAWQKHKAKFGFFGLIRALEITIGMNGYHPHTHELWFVDEGCNVNLLYDVVYDRWESACIKAGLLTEDKMHDFRKHSLQISDNALNSDYLQKIDKSHRWGVDREIAKASTKHSSGIHPFELLCEHCENLPLNKDVRSRMFLDYADAMKGKRQMYWSRGLKEWAGIKDKTDEEIVQELDEVSNLLGTIPQDHWYIVLREVAQPEILYRAETGGWRKVQEWFAEYDIRERNNDSLVENRAGHAIARTAPS